MQSRSPFLSRTIPPLTLMALALVAAACSDAGKSGEPTKPTPVDPMAPPAAPPPVTTSDRPLPPPVVGGTLLVTKDGATAVASDVDRDLISVVDLRSHKLTSSFRLAAGAEPGRLVEGRDGQVHVALRGAGQVITLDVAQARIVREIPVCAAPRGLAYDADRDLLHVACAGGELVTLAPDTASVVRTLHLDRDLRDVLVRGDDLLVTTFRKAGLLLVGADGQVTRQVPPRALAAFSSRPGFGKPFPTPAGGASDPGASPSSDPSLVNASPAVAWRMVMAPDGGAMVVHQRGVDDAVGTTPSAYGSGQACAGIVETAVSTMAPNNTIQSSRALTNMVVPVDMAASPDGRQVAIVAAGNSGTDQQLQFFDVMDVSHPPDPRDPCLPGSTIPSKPPADGINGDAGAGLPRPDGYLPPNGEVVAVAYDPAGNVIVQSRQPATLQVLTQRSEAIVLSTESRADAGHLLFHSATSGKLACASCHPEGSEDGRVWQFVGEGRRRTQSLRGGIMGTAPFHWNGTLTSLDHLMRDVFQGRMSGPAVSRGQVESLSRWLDGVRAVAPSTWHDAGAIARGQTLFNSAAVGCNSCHNGAKGTNNTTVDVGTGGLFQVPQLRDLAFRAPYLHDGCAATLADRFGSCGGGDKHGVTSQLTPGQIDDLVAYLETL